MTVLLIDGCGRKRQMEIPHWLPVILIPLPTRMSFTYDLGPPVFVPMPVAEFVYSDEPSYPPVYRQRIPQ